MAPWPGTRHGLSFMRGERSLAGVAHGRNPGPGPRPAGQGSAPAAEALPVSRRWARYADDAVLPAAMLAVLRGAVALRESWPELTSTGLAGMRTKPTVAICAAAREGGMPVTVPLTHLGEVARPWPTSPSDRTLLRKAAQELEAFGGGHRPVSRTIVQNLPVGDNLLREANREGMAWGTKRKGMASALGHRRATSSQARRAPW